MAFIKRMFKRGSTTEKDSSGPPPGERAEAAGPLPPAPEINAKFRAMMAERGIPGPAVDSMLQSDAFKGADGNAKKWQMVQQHAATKAQQPGEGGGTAGDGAGAAADHTNLLATMKQYSPTKPPSLDFMYSVRVQLSTGSVEWLEEFIADGGLDALEALLALAGKAAGVKAVEALVGGIKGAIKVESSLAAVQVHAALLKRLVACLVPPPPRGSELDPATQLPVPSWHARVDRTVREILRLLTVATSASGPGADAAHDAVLEGFEEAHRGSGDSKPFAGLIGVLHDADGVFTWDTKVVALMLLTEVGFGDTSLEDRVVIGTDLQAGGVLDALDDLHLASAAALPNLTSQLQQLHEQAVTAQASAAEAGAGAAATPSPGRSSIVLPGGVALQGLLSQEADAEHELEMVSAVQARLETFMRLTHKDQHLATVGNLSLHSPTAIFAELVSRANRSGTTGEMLAVFHYLLCIPPSSILARGAFRRVLGALQRALMAPGDEEDEAHGLLEGEPLQYEDLSVILGLQARVHDLEEGGAAGAGAGAGSSPGHRRTTSSFRSSPDDAEALLAATARISSLERELVMAKRGDGGETSTARTDALTKRLAVAEAQLAEARKSLAAGGGADAAAAAKRDAEAAASKIADLEAKVDDLANKLDDARAEIAVLSAPSTAQAAAAPPAPTAADSTASSEEVLSLRSRIAELEAALEASKSEASAAQASQPASSGGPRPSGGGPRPSGGGPRPSGGGPRPSGGGARPSGGGPRPSGGGPRPGGAGPRPSGGGPRPSGGGPRPSGGGPRPSGGGPRPSGGGPRPGGAGPRPGGGGPRPGGAGGPRPGGAGGPRPAGGGPRGPGAGAPRGPRMAGGGPRGPGMPLAPRGPGAGGAAKKSSKPKKPAVKPGRKMRGLFWNRIPDKTVDKTLWKGLSDEGVKLDVADLEGLFCADDPNKGKGGASASPKKASSGKKKSGPVLLLDGKRQQNAGIALARMKMKPDQVRAAVLAGDATALGEARVGILLGLVPTSEEVALLQGYDGAVAELGQVEKAFIAVMDIPLYEARLKAMSFRLRLEGLLADALEKANRTRKALDSITDSKAFKAVLEYVLALGNHLNGGTSRGSAYGFKMDVLKKLDEVKSYDNKLTLLQWIVRRARRNAGDPAEPFLRIPQDFKPISAADSESLDQLIADGKGLKANLDMVASTVSTLQGGGSLGAADKFASAFQAFLDDKGREVTKVVARIDGVQERFGTVCKDYGEDPKKTDSLKFFPMFTSFASAVESAIQWDEAAAERERKEAARAAKRGAKGPGTPSKGPGEEEEVAGGNLVDAKISRLHSTAKAGPGALIAEMQKRQAAKKHAAAARGGTSRARRRSMMPGARVLPKAA